MKKQHYTVVLLLLLCFCAANAQQDPMFTNYHFNSLTFNPAYAGSNEHLTANLMHRQQWVGFDGAPVTQSLIVHTPVKSPRIGVGFSMVHDKIGPTGTLDLMASYAYRFLLGKNSNLKLSLGVQAGVTNWHTDLINVAVEQGNDPSFQMNFTRWLPNFGAGALLTGRRFYAAFGCPRLLEHSLLSSQDDQVNFYAKTYRHWYTALGAALPLNGEQAVFRPSILLKSTGLGSSFKTDAGRQNIGAPTALNIDAALFLRQTFWIGVTYRTALQTAKSSSDSADLWAAWCMKNGIRLGAAYDITLSKLQQAGRTSFELMMGYEFDIKIKQVASPRYF